MERNEELELMTVTCPECGKKNFSFSRNSINKKNGLQIVCPECASTVSIKLTYEGDIFVQCLM